MPSRLVAEGATSQPPSLPRGLLFLRDSWHTPVWPGGRLRATQCDFRVRASLTRLAWCRAKGPGSPQRQSCPEHEAVRLRTSSSSSLGSVLLTCNRKLFVPSSGLLKTRGEGRSKARRVGSAPPPQPLRRRWAFRPRVPSCRVPSKGPHVAWVFAVVSLSRQRA